MTEYRGNIFNVQCNDTGARCSTGWIEEEKKKNKVKIGECDEFPAFALTQKKI